MSFLSFTPLVLAWVILVETSFPRTALAQEPGPPAANQPSLKDDEAPILITFEELKHEGRDKIAPSSATVPKRVRDWNGRLVSIEGYMLPPASLRFKMFVLESTPDMDPHITPLADEHVFVTCDGTEFSIRPVRVTGRFSIEDFKVEGTDKVYAMYSIREANVEVVKREPR